MASFILHYFIIALIDGCFKKECSVFFSLIFDVLKLLTLHFHFFYFVIYLYLLIFLFLNNIFCNIFWVFFFMLELTASLFCPNHINLKVPSVKNSLHFKWHILDIVFLIYGLFSCLMSNKFRWFRVKFQNIRLSILTK